MKPSESESINLGLQRKHLIKRKNLGYKISDGWLCEVKRKSPPSGSNVTKGDLVYVAQNGYAIFGLGVVQEVVSVQKKGFRNFVNYALNESKIKDDSFWNSKFKNYASGEDDEVYHILEYKLRDVVQFDVTYPLEERFLNQSAWYYLEDNFELKFEKLITELTKHIPTKMREEVYHVFKIQMDGEHIIDIDHVVPASLGGPGNIIENLIPISSSINRRKSNRVPSKIFDFAKKFDIKVPTKIKIGHERFYAEKEMKDCARKIIEKINQQPLDEIKQDYQQIRSFHFPGTK
jgi:hypothetical protein